MNMSTPVKVPRMRSRLMMRKVVVFVCVCVCVCVWGAPGFLASVGFLLDLHVAPGMLAGSMGLLDAWVVLRDRPAGTR